MTASVTLRFVQKFDPDQPRDESGRWGEGGGGAITSGSLSRKESGVIVDYKMGHSEYINYPLYKGKKLSVTADAEKTILDAAIEKSTLTEDATYYRGMYFLSEKWTRPATAEFPDSRKTFQPDLDPFRNSVGKVIENPAFTSLSVSENRALYFAQRSPLSDFATERSGQPVYKTYLIKLSVPKGTHVLDLNISGKGGIGMLTSHEQEVLLGRGAKMYVDSIHEGEGGVNIVRAKLIP